MEIDDFTARLDGVRQLPSGIAARCPSHPDQVASLSVNVGEHGGIVIRCHAGCAAESIVAAMGLQLSDLMGTPHVTAVYDYTDANGHVVYQVERWVNPKTFRCVPGLPPEAQRVPYNMAGIAYARDHGLPVFVVEGERDCHTLGDLGIVATTNVGGAGKWLPHYSEQLAGLDVIVVGDNDAPGRSHARSVAASVKSHAASVALMRTPVGKDVSEFLAAGYTIDGLVSLPDSEDVGVYRADRVRVRSVNWAWAGYLPLGKLSMIEGDPGDGKSLLTLDLAARWSTGQILPDGSNGAGPWNVVMVSAEDDPEDTLVPRLLAAGARLDYVHLVTHGATADVPFEIVEGMDALKRLVLDTGARIVVLDPLSAFLGDRTDSHNDHSVRRALQPLKMLAESTGAAVLTVRHLNKGGAGTKALYRSSGSIGFVGASRASFIVGRDPSDESIRILACTKSNLAHRPASLRYEIATTDDGLPYIRWRGRADMSAQMVLDGPQKQESDTASEANSRRKLREFAGDFLLDILKDGRMTWGEICEAGKADGVAARTLERARADVGLVKITGSRGQATTTWALPNAAFTISDHRSTTQSEAVSAISPSSPKNEALALTAQKTGELAKLADPNSLSVVEQDRDELLEAMPNVCTICNTSERVAKFRHPWWTVRCKAHNPMFYGGGSDEKN